MTNEETVLTVKVSGETTPTTHGRHHMEVHSGESCRACIKRFVGPALINIGASVGMGDCGGCGQDVEKFRYTYWFPYTEGES